MKQQNLYNIFLQHVSSKLDVLQDKPEETSENTLRALWFAASGDPKSAQSAETGDLPGLDSKQLDDLGGFIVRRLSGEPLAHITGRQQFMGYELLSGPEALVPRKETELLGSAAISLLKKMAKADSTLVVLDICTGVGNLAISYANSDSNTKVFASDLSADAVTLAQENVSFHNLSARVEVRVGDLLEPFDSNEYYECVDLLSCNPPYISSAKVDAMHQEISSFEPRLAFDGGSFGIKILHRLINQAPRYLRKGGWLVFEVGLGQGPGVVKMLEKNQEFEEVRSISDVNGDIRAILARK